MPPSPPPTMLHFNCEQSSMGRRLLHHSRLRRRRLKLKRLMHMKEKLSESRRCHRSASEACFNLLMGIYRTVTATVTVPIFVDPSDRPPTGCSRVNTNPVLAFDLLCDCDFSDAAYLVRCVVRRGASLSVASCRSASRNLDY